MQKIHLWHKEIEHFLTCTPKRCLAVSSIILIIAFIGIGYTGYTFGRDFPKTLIVKGVTNIENDPTVTADFSTFWESWNLIKNQHLDGAKLKEKKLLYGAIDGLTKAIGDANTNFFPPADAKQFEESVKGSFGGIGAEIGIHDEI